MAGNSKRIPQFLKAASAPALVRLMLSNNLKNGMQFDYQIMHDGKSFYAWFFLILDAKEALADAVQTGDTR
jgi:hypothetical protein